jgi:hypothetical protein
MRRRPMLVDSPKLGAPARSYRRGRVGLRSWATVLTDVGNSADRRGSQLHRTDHDDGRVVEQ